MPPSILAATGHRPDKLGGYTARAADRLEQVALNYLRLNRPDRVISGMALGWDQAWASAAICLDLPFDAAVPFDGQERAWPAESRARYRTLLALADRVVVVCPGGYAASKMQMRNEWMVDNCTALVALWDGSPGGTANCVRYAEGRVPVFNLYESYANV